MDRLEIMIENVKTDEEMFVAEARQLAAALHNQAERVLKDLEEGQAPTPPSAGTLQQLNRALTLAQAKAAEIQRLRYLQKNLAEA